MNSKHSRRAFLGTSGAFVGGSWLALSWPAILSTANFACEAHEAGTAFEVLDPSEAAAVDAIAAQILPSGDTPGAREAGAVYFIDRALGTFMARSAAPFRQGLEAFEDGIRAQHPAAASFAELSAEQQIEALRKAEQTPFFGLIRYLTLAGTFAHPSYGGNRDRVGWQLLGFDDHHAWHPPFGYYDEHEATDNGTDG